MSPGDIVWVPFPHVETNRLHPRPALIVAAGLGGKLSLCWALMITSAENETVPGDILIEDHQAVGLPIPSRIRTAKIATLAEASATVLGRLPDTLWRQVVEELAGTLSSGSS